jgi:hypothetical protein
MFSVPNAVAVYAARLGDLLAEAEADLDQGAFGDFLVLAASALAKQIAGKIEEDWQ